jgi:hypothetical protein
VWYDRFEDPESRAASGIDGMWRLNMVVFILGALPQIIKIFGMQGIPGTQTFAAVLLASFLLPEALRLSAGKAHAVEPLPIILRSKERFDKLQRIVIVIAVAVQVVLWAWVLSELLPDGAVFGGSSWYKVLWQLLCRSLER